MKKFFRIVTVSTIGLLCALTNTVYAAAGGAGGHPQLADPVLAMVVYTPATNFPLMAAQQDIAGQQKPVGLKAIPHNALGVVAGYLDPKSALALRATDTSLRGALSSHKIRANYVIDQIVSGHTPHPRVLDRLRALSPEDRQALLRTSLIEKFGKNKVFTIQNASIFPEDIAAVCQRAYVGADPIIQQHNKEHYFGSLDRERESNFIEGQYHTLTHLMDNPEDSRIPTYLTATQEELQAPANLAAVDAYFAAHPEVTLVLQAAAGNATFTLGRHNLPASVKKLSLVGDHVTSIGDGFLDGCTELTNLDLSALSNVTTIGDRFLIGCSGLTAIDLSPLSKVTTIERGFLQECSGLTAIDLSGLSNVTAIGDCFLSRCGGLTALDLSPLSQVTAIGNHFLSECTELTTLDLSALSHVTAIGDAFLSGCRGLTTLDLSPLSQVTSVRRHFLSGCRGLTTIDLSPLSHVTSVGNNFLDVCSGLTTIDLSPLSHVISVGNIFLHACSGLTTIDLSPLSQVTTIGHYFLCGCSGLTTINLSPLSHVISVRKNFLSGCSGLTTIDLSPLSHVTAIGEGFLVRCSGLTTEAQAAVAAFVAAHS